jgi:hypothetical protein
MIVLLLCFVVVVFVPMTFVVARAAGCCFAVILSRKSEI